MDNVVINIQLDLCSWLTGYMLGRTGKPMLISPVQKHPTLCSAGLYETGTTNLIYSWDQLLSDGAVMFVEEDGETLTDKGIVVRNFDSDNLLDGDLVLPNDGSITGIGSLGDANFTSVTIPVSVTKIYEGGFQYCRYIESIIYNGTMEQWHSIDLDNNCNNRSGINARKVSCSDGIVHIAGLYNEKTEMWPDGRDVPKIYEKMTWGEFVRYGGAVVDSEGLWTGTAEFSGDLVLPSDGSITYIGQFFNTTVESIVIPSTVTYLMNCTFTECMNLVSITIPSSVTSIENSVFDYCPHLETIIFEGTKEQWNAIERGQYWNDGVLAKEVLCYDGTVNLS